MNKYIKNASWIIVCRIGQSLVNLIIGMISARYLGPSNYGLINYAASVVAFVIPIMQLGLSKTLVQELIERPDREGEVLGTALLLNIISAFCCVGSVYLFLQFSNAGDELTVLVGVLYSISLIFQSGEILQYWFQAKLISKYTSVVSLAAYCVVALYKVYLLIAQKPVAWFALSNSLDFLLISAALIIIYNKIGKQRLKFSFRLGKIMLHRSKHYIISEMMVTIFAQTDRVMLKHLINETETGYYSAAVACVGVTGFIYVAIIDSLRPAILEAKHEQSPQYEVRMVQLYSIITYLALLQSIVMTLLAQPIVMVLYGADYMSSVLPLRIVVWYTTFAYYGSVRNVWILAEGKQKYLWIINLMGASANVLLNILLIPSLGAAGAAIASLLTQFFTNVIVGFILKPLRYNNTLMIKGLNPMPLIRYVRLKLSAKKK